MAVEEFENIFGYFPPDSTVKPTVLEVTYFDNDSVVISPVTTTEVFQVRLRFSKEMDPTIEPTIALDSDGTLDPVVPAGGTWSNIIVSGDSYETPYFALSGDSVGTITVRASGGTSEDGNVMDYNTAVDTFTLSGVNDPTGNGIAIDEGSEAVNHPNIALKLSSVGATLMWFSGDVVDDSQANEWITYAASGDVVLASGDGDGLKTVCAKFSDPSGNESAFVSDYVMLDRSGDAITDIACSNASGGSAIGNADWTTVNTPYFSWTAPASSGDIRGYAYVLTSGDGTEDELPDEINTFDPFVDYLYDTQDSGKYKFFVRAQDEASNWGSGDVFDFWLASGDLFDMPGQIRCWTSGDKLTEIEDGVVTSSGDGIPYIEMGDPQSPGDDTFYIQISGDNVNESDYAFSTVDSNYTFIDTLGVGITKILVRPITGLGVSGDVQEFNFIWASGDIT